MLGVETSCDDTAAAVVRSDGVVLGECIASQADIHEVIARRAAVCVAMVVVLCVCHRGCVQLYLGRRGGGAPRARPTSARRSRGVS